MDRMYKRADSVAVYATQADKDAGKPLKTVLCKPYSYGGYETYQVDGKFYPGYVDAAGGADACVILNVDEHQS